MEDRTAVDHSGNDSDLVADRTVEEKELAEERSSDGNSKLVEG